MSEKYNGFSNRETWAFKLHLDNDEGLYLEVKEFLNHVIGHEDLENLMDDVTSEILTVAKILKEIYEQLSESAFSGNKAARLIIEDVGSEWRIDFEEIASLYLEDYINEKRESA